MGNVAGEIDASLGTPAAACRGPAPCGVRGHDGGTSDTAPALGRPLLRSLWVSVVVKSRDPEMKYTGPGAMGIVALDSTAKSMSDPSITGRPYRRRVQSMAVSLRNYQ